MKKSFAIFLIVILTGVAIFLGFYGEYFLNNIYDKEIQNNEIVIVPNIEPEKIEVPDYVTITFAGDAMLDRGVEASVNKNLEGDYSKLFDNIDIFQGDDISFLNLEGPVSDVGHNVGSKYSFRMDPRVISALKTNGIDIVSFANNHVGDYTVQAFIDTLERLNNGEILFAGAGFNYAEATTPTVIEKNDIKTCFLASSDVGPSWMKATEKSAGILLANDPDFAGIISRAKINCDILIVSFHWGDEYKPHNARQSKLAHLAIDNGADIVVGAHPHVAQDIEIYNGKPIMYSLGNLIFDQSWSEETMRGLVVQMQVEKSGFVRNIQEYTTQQNKFFQIETIMEKKPL